MQYMPQIIADETKPLPAPTELARLGHAYAEFTQSIVDSGHFRAGVRLQPTSEATTVREKNAKRIVTDGPFRDAKEHLAGYYLMECAHLDGAIAIAARGARVDGLCW
jgi:hypothetical protein